MQNGNDYFAEPLDRLCPMVMPDTEGALPWIPSLAILYDKLEQLETLERQKRVGKQPQLLQEAEPAERGGKSHERSFWKAWSHIARWREQEVDALKEGKAKVFHRRQSEWAMTIMFCHWRISTAESRTKTRAVIYCECCEMWTWSTTAEYEDHKLGKYHKRNSRRLSRRPETSSTASSIGNETSSPASWVDDETWSTTSEIGWSTTSEIGSATYLLRFL